MRAFLNSFRYAARGAALCLRERNFRFHLVIAAYMAGFLLVYDWFVLSRAGAAALILAAALVLGAEAGNTALEAAVDFAGAQRHPLAARAKDAGAGAVLLCAAGAVGVGIAVLGQPAAFCAMFAYYRAKPLMLGVLGLSLAPSCLFIFTNWKAPGGRHAK